MLVLIEIYDFHCAYMVWLGFDCISFDLSHCACLVQFDSPGNNPNEADLPLLDPPPAPAPWLKSWPSKTYLSFASPSYKFFSSPLISLLALSFLVISILQQLVFWKARIQKKRKGIIFPSLWLIKEVHKIIWWNSINPVNMEIKFHAESPNLPGS